MKFNLNNNVKNILPLSDKRSLGSNIRVLYEDNHVIAVVKPAGILSQGDVTGEINMLDEVKKYIKEKYHKPGNVFLGLLHRLDRPVSGIMIFAKTSKGASRLSEQFRNHVVEKTYQAIVCGRPDKPKGVLVHHLIKDEKLKKAREHADGNETKLYYHVIASNKKYSLLQIKIEGGKFHQIRSQLSLAGIPILGDVKYKAPSPLPNGDIALCAIGLSFYGATEDKKIQLTIETPESWGSILAAQYRVKLSTAKP
jgi:23S rRNA pseudouridine1911/1915/1917 synthase